MHLFNKEAQSSGIIDGHEEVIIRSFELRDSHVIRNIFVTSMGEMRGPLVHDVMHQALLFGLWLVLPAAILDFMWSSWFLAFFLIALFVILLVLFCALHI